MRKAPTPRECANTAEKHVAVIHGDDLCQPCYRYQKDHDGRPRSQGLILAWKVLQVDKRTKKVGAR